MQFYPKSLLLLKKYYDALLKIENKKIGDLHFIVQLLDKQLLKSNY